MVIFAVACCNNRKRNEFINSFIQFPTFLTLTAFTYYKMQCWISVFSHEGHMLLEWVALMHHKVMIYFLIT